MLNKKDLCKIGIGTWKIDPDNFDNDLKGLLYSYNNGQNYLSLYMLYNNGEVVRKMKEFIKKIDRNKIFITVNLEPMIEKVEDVSKQLNEYLEILNIDYVDCLQLHSPAFSKISLIDVYKEINSLKDNGKVRYIGISNVNLDMLKEVNNVVKIDFFEGIYNLECKIYEDNGVLDYCNKNDIKFICYQPLRRNRTANRNYPLLVDLANKYHKTQNQIILNYIINEKKIMPIVKSTNIDRINENLDSLNFKMDREDYDKLNKFRSKEFDSVIIDWSFKDGVFIDQLANQFE